MSWNVRIGINPLSWMNDDLPSLGGETLLETALKEGKEIGYEGFELGNKFLAPGTAVACGCVILISREFMRPQCLGHALPSGIIGGAGQDPAISGLEALIGYDMPNSGTGALRHNARHGIGSVMIPKL